MGTAVLWAWAVVWGMGYGRVMLWPWDPACGDRGISLLLTLSLLSQLCWVRSSRASSRSWRDYFPSHSPYGLH